MLVPLSLCLYNLPVVWNNPIQVAKNYATWLQWPLPTFGERETKLVGGMAGRTWIRTAELMSESLTWFISRTESDVCFVYLIPLCLEAWHRQWWLEMQASIDYQFWINSLEREDSNRFSGDEQKLVGRANWFSLGEWWEKRLRWELVRELCWMVVEQWELGTTSSTWRNTESLERKAWWKVLDDKL